MHYRWHALYGAAFAANMSSGARRTPALELATARRHPCCRISGLLAERLRIDNLVAACGERGVVTGFLLPDLVICLHRLVGGLDRGFDGVFRDGFDDLRRHGTIDADTSHANAKQPHDVTAVSPALVAVGIGLRSLATLARNGR